MSVKGGGWAVAAGGPGTACRISQSAAGPGAGNWTNSSQSNTGGGGGGGGGVGREGVEGTWGGTAPIAIHVGGWRGGIGGRVGREGALRRRQVKVSSLEERERSRRSD